jgi:hypothetical protein
MDYQFDIDDSDFQLQLKNARRRTLENALAVITEQSALLETAVKSHASGRPGPRAVTGDYRRSITTAIYVSPDRSGILAVVGTNKPQGRRLEYGFIGVDALGRHYNQPPYPHFRPAIVERHEPFLEAVRKITK